MATGGEVRARLVIDASTEGRGDIEAVANEVEALAKEGGEAAPKFTELAKSLREMGQQDKLIDEFSRLKREVQGSAQEMDKAASKVDKLAGELSESGAAALRAAEAQAKAGRELDTARQWQQQLRDAIARTKAELKDEREALRAAGADSALYAQRVADGAAQLKTLQAEQQQASAAVRMAAAAYKESEAASKNAATAQKQLAGEYDHAVTNAAQLSGALSRGNQALADVREQLVATGIDTKGLSAEQLELKNRLLQAQQQAQQYTSVMGELRGETQSLAPALEATFKQLGMRGVRQITAEIEQLQAVMRGLSKQSMLPQDAQRAAAELQRRIEALQGEMRTAQTSTKGLSNDVKGLGNTAETTSSQLGAAAHKAIAWTSALVGIGELKKLVTTIVETGSSFQQLEGRLTSILGTTEAARSAFAMLQDLAQKTPFDVKGLTEAYAKLAAFGLQPTRAQMLAMADTAATLGGGTEALAGITLALGQAWTKGKLQGEELMQMAERGVPVWDLLAQATGKNVAQLQKMSEAGQLGRETITQLIDAMGKKNAGASGVLMATFAGAVASAQDALQGLFNLIAQSGVLDYLNKQLQGLLARFNELQASGELEKMAKRVATGFVQVAESAQNVLAVLRMLAPVIEVAVAAMAANKVMKWAEALRGAKDAASGAAMANGVLAQSADLAAGAQGRLSRAATLAMGALSQVARLATGAGYAAIAFEVIKLVDAWGALRREREKQIALAAASDQKDAQVAKRLREIADATGLTISSMQEFNALVETGALVFDQAAGKWETAVQAQERMAAATKANGAAVSAFGATVLAASNESVALVTKFDQLRAGADDSKKAIEGLVESFNFGDVQGVTAWIVALEELRTKGKLGAAEVGQAWQQALSGLSTKEIAVLRTSLEDAAKAGVISARDLAQANEQILMASFDKLGVNAAQALGKISTGAQGAIDSVSQIAEAAKAAGVGTEKAARAIEMAFAAAIPKADSLEAINALRGQLEGMGKSGQIGAEGVKRINTALDEQKVKIEQQMPGVQSLEEALKQLGVTPQAELKRLAETAKEAFDAVLASGKATPREINEAWKKMAEAAIAANNGVADSTIQAQASQHGMVIETDKAGKSIVKSMEEAADATKSVGDAAKDSADKLGELDNAAWDHSRSLAEQAREHNAALAKTESSWIDASVAASKYADEAAKVIWTTSHPLADLQKAVLENKRSLAELTAEHKRLVEALETLDKQQKQMEETGNGAAKGVDDLRLRLLELNGTEEQIAKARHERDIAEVKRQQQLMAIELERARLRKDDDEAARLEKELALYGEQLKLLDQIFQKEEQQRKKKEQDERKQAADAKKQSDTSSGGSGSSGSGGTSSSGGNGGIVTDQRPVNYGNITLNAYGINDPVKLLNMLEPEMAKRARLSR